MSLITKKFILEVPEVREITEVPGGEEKNKFLDFQKLQKLFSKNFHLMTQKVECTSQHKEKAL